jgi:hypothetical protein
VHKLYPYLKTPLFVVENQFDTNQIQSSDGKVPKHPSSAEVATVERYVGMYGEAMRNSTAQVLADASVVKKRVPDGLFHPAGFCHPTDFEETITPAGGEPQSWQLLLGDWFFEQNQHQKYHRLVETCPTDAPCNPLAECQFTNGTAPTGDCTAQLKTDGCTQGGGLVCEACARVHKKDLGRAGCTRDAVQQFCAGGRGN